MIDYHIHTKLCKHAEGEMYQYIESAISKGITEIAFTDHNPLPNNFDLAHRMHISEIDNYLTAIEKLKSRYPEIKILTGIEADYVTGFENYLEKFITGYEFDLVIMSVHFIAHWPAGNWVFDYSFPDRTQQDVFADYIQELIRGIRTGLFDILGHADLIKISGQSLLTSVPDQIELLLQAISEKEMAIEINTSGYRRPIQQSYPGLDWLDMLQEYRIPITTGSDAHHPGQIALNFNQLYRHLIEKGYNHLCGYRGRQKINVPLVVPR